MVFSKYKKLFIAVAAAVVSAVVAATGGGGITSVEWVNIAIAGVTAASVFTAPEVPGSKYTKTILAVLGAVLVALTSYITGGIHGDEWWQLLSVALGALGVGVFPNTVDGVNIADTGDLGVG